MIELAGIAIREKPGAAMIAKATVEVTTQGGLAGDCRGRPGRRQVTVLSVDAWQQACRELGRDLPWLVRRANLLVSGITFGPGDIGRELAIGNLRLRITGETDPCRKMELACPGLMAALMPDWRGGVCCRVVQSGAIAVGDGVVLWE